MSYFHPVGSIEHNGESLSTGFYNKSTDYEQTLDVLFESFKDTSFVFASPNRAMRHEWNRRNQRFLLNIPWNEQNVSRILLYNPETQNIIGHAVVGIIKTKKPNQSIIEKINDYTQQIDSYYSLLLWIVQGLSLWFVFLPFKFGFYSCWKLTYIPSKYWVPYNRKQKRFLHNNNLSKVFIKQFCISPQYQGKGYGTVFMNWILNKYANKRYSECPVIIQCISMKARSFYLKLGFKEFAGFRIRTNYGEMGNGHRLIWYHDTQQLSDWMKHLQVNALFGKIKNEHDVVEIGIKQELMKNRMFLLLYAVVISPYIIASYFIYKIFLSVN